MSSKSILVIGAGELGLAVLRALALHPSKPGTTVLLRPAAADSPSRVQLTSILRELNIGIIYGNLSDPPDELAKIFAPYHTVISCSGFVGGPGTQKRLCEAAIKSGIHRYLPWQFGVDYDAIGRGSSQDLFDEQLDVRDTLRAQNKMRWTIISTGMFTSFLFEPFFGVVALDADSKLAQVTALGKWENEVTVTSAEDIGRCTAEILLGDNGGHGLDGVVHIAGDTVTFAGLARILADEGWKVQKEVTTVEELEQKRREDPENNVLKYQLIWARNKGVSWAKKDSWNGRKGIETEGVAEWIRQNLSGKPKA
jgi:hypothetical protein